jgi:TolA-binding protein
MAKKQEHKSTEVLENPEALVDRFSQAEEFVRKNQKILSYIGTGVAILIGGIIGFFYYLSTQEEEAQSVMFPAVFYFEKDSFDLALNGNGVNSGLIEVADNYSLTKAGKLAALYTGTIYLKQGQFEEALEYLEKFSSSDAIVQARAYVLRGDANMELKNYAEAANFYKKGSTHAPNKQFTPGYMMKWALAEELAGNTTEAAYVYEKLIEEYPLSSDVNDAKKYLARIKPEVK